MRDSDVTAIGGEAAMGILRGMRVLNELPGHDLGQLQPKTVIRMRTNEGHCTLVIVDPKHLVVVLFRHPAERYGRPRFATLRGAGSNGHLKVGWILAGASAEFDMDNGTRFVFENVVSMFEPVEGPEEADILIAAAKETSS